MADFIPKHLVWWLTSIPRQDSSQIKFEGGGRGGGLALGVLCMLNCVFVVAIGYRVVIKSVCSLVLHPCLSPSY